MIRTSLAVQWLRLQASTAGGTSLTPGQGTKTPSCHMQQQRKNPALHLRSPSPTWNPWKPPVLLLSLCLFQNVTPPSWITTLLWQRGLHNSMSHALQGYPRRTDHSEGFWWNGVHWRRKWQPTPVFLPGESHGLNEGKRRRGRQRMRWIDSVTYSVGMNLSKLRELLWC